jgi:hypothetical protein
MKAAQNLHFRAPDKRGGSHLHPQHAAVPTLGSTNPGSKLHTLPERTWMILSKDTAVWTVKIGSLQFPGLTLGASGKQNSVQTGAMR